MACKFSGRDPNGVGDNGGKIARFCKITRKEAKTMAKKVKVNLEFLLVKAEVKGVPEKALLKSRNIGQVDLIWQRTGCAEKVFRPD